VNLLLANPHALSGLYALDALEGAGQVRFERHMSRCHACADEVRGLRETAARLAVLAAAQPPPGMRERVLAQADVTAQLLPPAGQPVQLRRRRGLATRLAVGLTAALAAAATAAAIVFAVAQQSTQHRLDQALARNRAVAAVLAAPDARAVAGTTAHGGTVTVVLSRAQRELIVSANGLPPLPAAKVYQLWLIGPVKIRSAGLLPSPLASRSGPVLASGLGPGDKFGVTVEPAGGSAQPTTVPILLLRLPA
jgi:anti-sigma-K factor RskA